MATMLLENGWTHYRDEGSGPAIVLIHGMGLDLTLWDDHAAELSSTFRVIRLDTLGHGETQRPDRPEWSFREYASQVAELLEKLSVDRATIVGFSLGGSIAQRFALDYPDKTQALIVVASVCDRTPAELEAVLQRLSLLASDGPAAIAGNTIDRWFTPEFQRANPEIVSRWLRRILANDPYCYVTAYKAYS